MKNLEKNHLVLSEKDNIVVLLRAVKSGEIIDLNGQKVVVRQALEMGQKLASRTISCGEDVFKYGMPIGFAAIEIAIGEHVHIHNINSRYTVIEKMD